MVWPTTSNHSKATTFKTHHTRAVPAAIPADYALSGSISPPIPPTTATTLSSARLNAQQFQTIFWLVFATSMSLHIFAGVSID